MLKDSKTQGNAAVTGHSGKLSFGGHGAKLPSLWLNHIPASAMKRAIPSLVALEVFEACARYMNFTRAAEELGITQSAVSRQIAYLEGFLGVKLFERVRRRVLITSAGKEYAEKIKAVLRQTEKATEEIATAQTGKILHISSYATFAAKWLAPRLVSFAGKYPDMPFQLTALNHHRAFASQESAVDVAIHYGEASWPDSLLDRLMHETIVPVCSPGYAESHRIKTPADLARATLLHQIKTDAWPDMFDRLGLQRTHSHSGLRFDQYAMVIEATLNGLGVAAIPNFLIESDLATGRLVALFDVSVQSRYAYYLVYPEVKRNWKNIKAFRRWIVAEARHSEQKNRI